MNPRGSERPEDGPEERRDARAKGRRWGRGRSDAEPEATSGGEDFGWIDDLRTAKQERSELGPGGAPAGGPGQVPSPAVPPVRPAPGMPSARPAAGLGRPPLGRSRVRGRPARAPRRPSRLPALRRQVDPDQPPDPERLCRRPRDPGRCLRRARDPERCLRRVPSSPPPARPPGPPVGRRRAGTPRPPATAAHRCPRRPVRTTGPARSRPAVPWTPRRSPVRRAASRPSPVGCRHRPARSPASTTPPAGPAAPGR